MKKNEMAKTLDFLRRNHFRPPDMVTDGYVAILSCEIIVSSRDLMQNKKFNHFKELLLTKADKLLASLTKEIEAFKQRVKDA